jgi:ankyrin repeat protein
MAAFILYENKDLKILSEKIKPDIAIILTWQDGKGRTLLDWARIKERHDILQYVAELVNQKDTNDYTPLQAAAHSGNEFLVNKLIAAGAVIAQERSQDKSTALSMAIAHSHVSVARTLIQEYNRQQLAINPRCLYLACYKGCADLISILLDSGVSATDYTGLEDDLQPDYFKDTPLHMGVRNRLSIEALRYLIEVGEANINKKIIEHHEAAYRRINGAHYTPGYTPLHVAAKAGTAAAAQLLITKGADIEAKTLGHKNNENMTPLHVAILFSNPAVAAVLVANGADIDALDAWGRTPLSFVGNLPEESAKIMARILLVAKLERYAKSLPIIDSIEEVYRIDLGFFDLATKHKLTTKACTIRQKRAAVAALICVVQGKSVNLLAAHKAALTQGKELSAIYTQITKILPDLSLAKIKINMANFSMQGIVTNLNAAAARNNAAEIINLMESGMLVNWDTASAALHLAVAKGYLLIVETFIEWGVLPDVSINESGDTPLHTAMRYEHVAIANLLIAQGAALGCKNKAAQTPMDIAKSQQNAVLVSMLLLPKLKCYQQELTAILEKNNHIMQHHNGKVSKQPIYRHKFLGISLKTSEQIFIDDCTVQEKYAANNALIKLLENIMANNTAAGSTVEVNFLKKHTKAYQKDTLSRYYAEIKNTLTCIRIIIPDIPPPVYVQPEINYFTGLLI